MRNAFARRGLLPVVSCLLLALSVGCAGPRVVASCLRLDGRPFFPVEVYSLSAPEDVAHAARLGFNATINEFPELIHAAGDHGLAVTVPDWFEGDLDTARLDQRIARTRGLAGVWAWNVGDEPELRPRKSPPDLVGRAARYVRTWMPKALISVTLSGALNTTARWSAYLYDVDLVRVAAYPLLEGAGSELVYDRVRLARKLSGGRPVIAVLDSWTMPRKPYRRPEALRLDLYAAVTAGVAGVSIYRYEQDRWTDGAEAGRLGALVREARALGALVSRGREGRCSAQGGLKRLDFTIGLRKVTIAVNLGDEPASVRLAVGAFERCWRVRDRGALERMTVTDGVVESALPPGGTALFERGLPYMSPAIAVSVAAVSR